MTMVTKLTSPANRDRSLLACICKNPRSVVDHQDWEWFCPKHGDWHIGSPEYETDPGALAVVVKSVEDPHREIKLPKEYFRLYGCEVSTYDKGDTELSNSREELVEKELNDFFRKNSDDPAFTARFLYLANKRWEEIR